MSNFFEGFAIKRTINLILAVVCFICPFAFGQNDIEEDLFPAFGTTLKCFNELSYYCHL